MGNRLYSLKPIDAAKLLRSWGWVDEGSVKSHGTTRRWRWPATNDAVSLHTTGVKRHEMGVKAAMSQAAAVMDLPLQVFLRGPVKLPRPPVEQPELVLLGPPPQPKEPPVVNMKLHETPRTGLAANVRRAVQSTPNKVWNAEEMQTHLRDALGLEFGIHVVQSTLASIAKQKPGKYPRLERIERGQYAWRAIDPSLATPAPVSRSHHPTPVSSHDETPAPKPPTTPVSVIRSTQVTNGSTPELLSRVALLDGGRCLFQGDDGELYVVTSLTKLALPS